MLQRICLIGVIAVSSAAVAQTPLPDAELHATVQRGELATLASLCSLRDESWTEDLRKATIQDATRSSSPQTSALRDAPGSDTVVSALGYAETEATEDFAGMPPDVACKKLVRPADLAAAAARVAAYRRDLARARFSGS